MKRTSIIACLAIAATSASAAELPIAETYGNPRACIMYRAYGPEAVAVDGIYPFPEGVEVPPHDDYFLVRRSGLVSVEFGCDVISVEGYDASLACWEAGDEEPTDVRAKFSPVESGFDLQFDDYEPFRIIPREKPTS